MPHRESLPFFAFLLGIAAASCSAGSSDTNLSGGSGGSSADAGEDAPLVPDAPPEGAGGTTPSDACPPACSDDFRAVVGCDDEILKLCSLSEMCAEGACVPACEAADTIRSSVGCEYFPVAMDGYMNADNGCFAVFVANTWPTAAHLSVDYRGAVLAPEQFGYLPKGSGTKLTYESYDPAKGIPPGEVAILFLSGPGSNPGGAVECPEAPAITNGSAQVKGTGKGHAFHIVSSVPVVAYQILPYGGGNAAVTGASLLLPTGAWDTNYVAVNAFRRANIGTLPSLNLVAMRDGTEVRMVPRVAVASGTGVANTKANELLTIQLNRGEQVQITQSDELTGSPIESNHPIALMAGHECMQVPIDKGFCDHAEQQIPPVRALGSEYVAAGFRQRSNISEAAGYRIIGAVDGTELTFDPPSVHPAKTLQFGDVLEFASAQAFVVRSQDASHPFLVAAYMSGSETVKEGYGDPDFVRLVPPRQYLQRYVFFTDPTYPETNLVVVREKGPEGFVDVELACRGKLDGWQAVGSGGRFEFTRVDLVRHDFEPQGGCDNGRHEMKSDLPFGLTVWGWGTTETVSFTRNVSYGYPAGESVVQLNDIYVPSVPK
jgi:hypothetical protein